MKTTYQTGLAGEKRAAEWLNQHCSMKLLETRFRNKAGEIDLIMLDGDTIVFVEVKTRLKAESGCGLAAVDSRKQRKIANAAILFLISKGWQSRKVRFDVVEVSTHDIIHVADAFRPGGMFF